MILLEDTRNPVSKHRNIHEWAAREGVTIKRTKLMVGDYTLPTDQSVCIDTKAGLQEVYSNVVQQHARFRAECELAKEAGIRLVVLVEEPGIYFLEDVAKWRNPRRERWFKVNAAHKAGKLTKLRIPPTPPQSSSGLMLSMGTMADRYGVEWRFCSPSETGAQIWRLLGGSKPHVLTVKTRLFSTEDKDADIWMEKGSGEK